VHPDPNPNQVRRTGVRRSMQDPQVQSWLADPALLQGAKAVAEQVTKRRAAGSGRVIKCVAGAVGTTDTWHQSPQAIEQIHSEAATLCEEMEAAAVAQVALARGGAPK
jgi:nucleoside phosphorylase